MNKLFSGLTILITLMIMLMWTVYVLGNKTCLLAHHHLIIYQLINTLFRVLGMEM